MGAVVVEVRDEPQGTLGSARRVCRVRRAALRLCRDAALARRMGFPGTLLWLRPCDHTVAGPQRARTPSRADVLPDAEWAATLGQGVRCRGDGALRSLADLDALGRC